jgi:hypothetical protein
VINGSGQGELKKDFDGSLKGNVFFLEGHKIIMPSASSSNEGGKHLTSSTGKLDIVHRYLVIQMFLASGDPFSLEVQFKDKTNVSFHNCTHHLLLSAQKKTYVFRWHEGNRYQFNAC